MYRLCDTHIHERLFLNHTRLGGVFAAIAPLGTPVAVDCNKIKTHLPNDRVLVNLHGILRGTRPYA